jgi:hypothetical protein
VKIDDHNPNSSSLFPRAFVFLMTHVVSVSTKSAGALRDCTGKKKKLLRRLPLDVDEEE